MGLLGRGLGALLCLMAAGQAGAAPLTYTVRPLDQLGEGSWRFHLRINNAGQVMGTNGIVQPDGALTPLPFQAAGMNEAGEVVGADAGIAKLWSPVTGVKAPSGC